MVSLFQTMDISEFPTNQLLDYFEDTVQSVVTLRQRQEFDKMRKASDTANQIKTELRRRMGW